MRITGGILAGRVIKTPRDAVRPTQERVREAIFSSLASVVQEAHALDLFAGTGALGVEAWSRGASSVHWVEQHGGAFKQLRANVQACCGTDAAHHCHHADVFTFLKRPHTQPFDLILADPPYDRHSASFDLTGLLNALREGEWLHPNGLLVFEQRASSPVVQDDHWRWIRDRSYGHTRVLFGRRYC